MIESLPPSLSTQLLFNIYQYLSIDIRTNIIQYSSIGKTNVKVKCMQVYNDMLVSYLERLGYYIIVNNEEASMIIDWSHLRFVDINEDVSLCISVVECHINIKKFTDICNIPSFKDIIQRINLKIFDENIKKNNPMMTKKVGVCINGLPESQRVCLTYLLSYMQYNYVVYSDNDFNEILWIYWDNMGSVELQKKRSYYYTMIMYGLTNLPPELSVIVLDYIKNDPYKQISSDLYIISK